MINWTNHIAQTIDSYLNSLLPQEEEEGFKMAPSNFVPTINEGSQNYASVWKDRKEEGNPQQKHDVELVKEEKRLVAFLMSLVYSLEYVACFVPRLSPKDALLVLSGRTGNTASSLLASFPP